MPAGGRHSLTLATGETISGDVWYRARNQVGLTVDNYGNGLLVLVRRPTTAKSPHGGGHALISTYGLSDAALADLRAKWTAWLEANYEVIEIHSRSRSGSRSLSCSTAARQRGRTPDRILHGGF